MARGCLVICSHKSAALNDLGYSPVICGSTRSVRLLEGAVVTTLETVSVIILHVTACVTAVHAER